MTTPLPLPDGEDLSIDLIKVTTPMVNDMRRAATELMDTLITSSQEARRDGISDVEFIMNVIGEAVEGIQGTGPNDVIMRAIGEGILVSTLVLRIRDGAKP